MGKEKKRRTILMKALKCMLWFLLICAVCCGALVAYVYYMELNVPAPGSDYDGIIVLGAQVLPDGRPSVQLRLRIDEARAAYMKKHCIIVTCGGKGKSEPRPEGDVMRDLLIIEGVNAEHVISDPCSEDTRQNIGNALRLLDEFDVKKPLIVTSDYHLPRALAIMDDIGYKAYGIGSKCNPRIDFWLKNHCREALAWVKYWGVKYLGLDL